MVRMKKTTLSELEDQKQKITETIKKHKEQVSQRYGAIFVNKLGDEIDLNDLKELASICADVGIDKVLKRIQQ